MVIKRGTSFNDRQLMNNKLLQVHRNYAYLSNSSIPSLSTNLELIRNKRHQQADKSVKVATAIQLLSTRPSYFHRVFAVCLLMQATHAKWNIMYIE